MASRAHPAQLDLFVPAAKPVAARTLPGARPAIRPDTLPDEDLVAVLETSTGQAARDLAAEAGRRKLTLAVSALEGLYRRFRGFDVHATVSEQTASLEALATIGGADARAAVTALLNEGVVQPPALPGAMAVAERLGCRLTAPVVTPLLQHPDPRLRRCAASCALSAMAGALVDLLTDPSPDVADTAACTLGRMGRSEARFPLSLRLHADPTPVVIEAAACVADDTIIVLLGRIARGEDDAARAALRALQDLDDERAAAIITSLQARTAPSS